MLDLEMWNGERWVKLGEVDPDSVQDLGPALEGLELHLTGELIERTETVNIIRGDI